MLGSGLVSDKLLFDMFVVLSQKQLYFFYYYTPFCFVCQRVFVSLSNPYESLKNRKNVPRGTFFTWNTSAYSG